MSWSFYATGTGEKVKEAAKGELEKQAASYDTTSPGEARDIRDALTSIVSMIDYCKLEPDSYAPGGYGVDVAASGSRSASCCSTKIELTRKRLLV
jgi:hypothetical protein